MSGVPDPRWNNSDLNRLRTVLGANFEAVDQSSLMIDPNSGKAKQLSPTGVSWGGDNTPASMNAGAVYNVGLSFTNTGTQPWRAGGPNPVRLSYHWRHGACPGTSLSVWDGLRTALPGDVAAGTTVSNLVAQVKAPGAAGTYCLQYDLVREGMTWLSWQGAPVLAKTVSVAAPLYGVAWGSDSTPVSMTRNAVHSVSVSFTNTGSLTWNATGANPVRFAYHWRSGACPGTSVSVWDGLRTPLPGSVNGGAAVSGLAVQVRAPSTPGTYCLQYDLVREGVAWFSWQGAPFLARTVRVNLGPWERMLPWL
jgi:hypothetical protein